MSGKKTSAKKKNEKPKRLTQMAKELLEVHDAALAELRLQANVARLTARLAEDRSVFYWNVAYALSGPSAGTAVVMLHLAVTAAYLGSVRVYPAALDCYSMNQPGAPKLSSVDDVFRQLVAGMPYAVLRRVVHSSEKRNGQNKQG